MNQTFSLLFNFFICYGESGMIVLELNALGMSVRVCVCVCVCVCACVRARARARARVCVYVCVCTRVLNAKYVCAGVCV